MKIFIILGVCAVSCASFVSVVTAAESWDKARSKSPPVSRDTRQVWIYGSGFVDSNGKNWRKSTTPLKTVGGVAIPAPLEKLRPEDPNVFRLENERNPLTMSIKVDSISQWRSDILGSELATGGNAEFNAWIGYSDIQAVAIGIKDAPTDEFSLWKWNFNGHGTGIPENVSSIKEELLDWQRIIVAGQPGSWIDFSRKRLALFFGTEYPPGPQDIPGSGRIDVEVTDRHDGAVFKNRFDIQWHHRFENKDWIKDQASIDALPHYSILTRMLGDDIATVAQNRRGLVGGSQVDGAAEFSYDVAPARFSITLPGSIAIPGAAIGVAISSLGNMMEDAGPPGAFASAYVGFLWGQREQYWVPQREKRKNSLDLWENAVKAQFPNAVQGDSRDSVYQKGFPTVTPDPAFITAEDEDVQEHFEADPTGSSWFPEAELIGLCVRRYFIEQRYQSDVFDVSGFAGRPVVNLPQMQPEEKYIGVYRIYTDGD